MPTQTLEQFLSGKSFAIPAYQRDYAWKSRNIDDLFDDITEALESRSTHYLGAFILSRATPDGRYRIVDGQQRLTTVTMLANALVAKLPESEGRRAYFEYLFLKSLNKEPKLMLMGANQEFFAKILRHDHSAASATNQSQKLLLDGYEQVRLRVNALSAQGPDAILNLLDNVRMLEVLEFVEADEGKAIRMFQSVNDRGVLLSNMDKVKSILIYYSSLFLGGRLDSHINDRFGGCYRDYNSIKELSREPGFQIRQVNRETFTEDDILRYHYLAFDPTSYDSQAGFDFYATSDYVLNAFIKGTLKRLRSSPEKLVNFIQQYVDDLSAFFKAMSDLVDETRSEESVFQIFCILNLSATLYPLIIRLRQRGLLHENIPNNPLLTLIKLIEIADVRVYKTRGTDPAKDVHTLSRKAGRLSVAQVAEELRTFVSRFMEDTLFRAKLGQEMYGNTGINRMFLEYEKSAREQLDEPLPTLTQLSTMLKKEPTIEHILPEEPNFGFPNYGFSNREEYDLAIHHLGNLTLLEKSLNSRANDAPVETKVRDEHLYQESDYKMTRGVAAAAAGRNPVFSRIDMEDRTRVLAQFCADAWPLWASSI
jgi:hypothetical protein